MQSLDIDMDMNPADTSTESYFHFHCSTDCESPHLTGRALKDPRSYRLLQPKGASGCTARDFRTPLSSKTCIIRSARVYSSCSAETNEASACRFGNVTKGFERHYGDNYLSCYRSTPMQ